MAIMELIENFRADLAAGPEWIVWWVRILGGVILLAIPFAFVRREARWLVLIIAITLPLMLGLYNVFGNQRILGLGHVLPWTPYVIYLWNRRAHWQVRETISGKWLVAVFSVMTISLVMDYSDVVRFFLGERL